MLSEPGRIIVSRTDRIGDVVLSLPVFASLKECFPRTELVALVRGYTAEIVSSFRAVDRVLVYDDSESSMTTAKKLKSVHADAILFLYPRFRLAAAAVLAGIPARVGTAYRSYSFLHNKRVHEHRRDSLKSEAEYNLSLAKAIGCKSRVMDSSLEIDGEALRKAERFLVQKGIDRFIVVHPGSGGSAADWSAGNFRRLCEKIPREFNMTIVVTGSAAERDLCTGISQGIGNCVMTCGEFSLREFIAFLSRAAAFVSNSTGPIHLAASVGTPVVGIYPNNKPMTPARWSPITDRKIILTPADGSDDLSSITVEKVFGSLRSIMPVDAK